MKEKDDKKEEEKKDTEEKKNKNSNHIRLNTSIPKVIKELKRNYCDDNIKILYTYSYNSKKNKDKKTKDKNKDIINNTNNMDNKKMILIKKT